MSQVFSQYIDHVWPSFEQELSTLRLADSRRVLGKTRRSLWLNQADFKHLGKRGGKAKFRAWARPIFDYERREFIRASLQRRDELRAFRDQASVSLKVPPKLRRNRGGGQAIDVLLNRLGKKQPGTVPIIKQWLNQKPLVQICGAHGLTSVQFRRHLCDFLEVVDHELCYLNGIESRSLNRRVVFESAVSVPEAREPRKKICNPIINRWAQDFFRKVVHIDRQPIEQLMSLADGRSEDDATFVRDCVDKINKMFDQLTVDMDEFARLISFIAEVVPGLLDFPAED